MLASALSKSRGRAPAARLDDVIEPAHRATPEREVLAKEEASRVRIAIAELPEPWSSAAELRWLQGWSFHRVVKWMETAHRIGSRQTRNVLDQAREKIRRILDERSPRARAPRRPSKKK